MVKKWGRASFVFRTIILAQYLFDENFIGLVKEPLY